MLQTDNFALNLGGNCQVKRDKSRQKSILSLSILAKLDIKKTMLMSPREEAIYWKEKPIFKSFKAWHV